jgi:hypothetical protein
MNINASVEEMIEKTSAGVHNNNCYRYLKTLRLSEFVMEGLPLALQKKLKAIRSHTDYQSNYPYADTYRAFFTEVEENIEKIYDKRRDALKGNIQHIKQIEELDDFIFSIFDNENLILNHTFEVIKGIPLQHTPADNEIEVDISTLLKDSGKKVNKTSQSPAEAGSLFGRLNATISDELKLQHTISLPTVRSYSYHVTCNTYPREYRLGTQGQRHKGKERVSPLFERWLRVSQLRHNPQQLINKITHIYFNSLALDRIDIEGKKERNLTNKLQELEEKYSNIAVITLPADKGLMSKKDHEETTDSHSYYTVYNEFLLIAKENSENTIKDFYISKKIRGLLFKGKSGSYSPDIETIQLKILLDKSFASMGIATGSPLTSAQRQAVWFHFNKFELTNYIIKHLKPYSINFSCKHAIDRGGVASAYYNLIQSFTTTEPLTRESFECALHAAPAMVQGRGMNYHLKVIWNTIDSYVNAHYKELKIDKYKTWLLEWRDFNCPHARVPKLLDLRVEQCLQELHDALATSPQDPAIKKGICILRQIKIHKDLGVSGKRLLLEATMRTTHIALGETSPEKLQVYLKLAAKMNINYPKLQMLAGLMKIFIGYLISKVTFGQTASLLSSGLATFKAAQEVRSREEIQQNMREMEAQLKVRS